MVARRRTGNAQVERLWVALMLGRHAELRRVLRSAIVLLLRVHVLLFFKSASASFASVIVFAVQLVSLTKFCCLKQT